MATAPPPPQTPNALRVAVSWGTTVVALKTLARGQSFIAGDAKNADLPIPEGVDMALAPIRAAAGGWELDARGCVGGLLTLRGRAEDPVAIARTSAAVPIMPGDFGLIQYGQVSLFFQYTTQPIKMSTGRVPELLVLLAGLCSAILHLGGVGLLSTLSTPLPYPKPPELETQDDLAKRFQMKRSDLDPPPPPPEAANAGEKPGGAGIPDPGARDKKEQGGGKKIKGDEGKFGMNKDADHTSLPGEIKPTTHYGGLSEVLEGDTGKEIQNTLKSINTVSAALSGLNSKDMVLGSGPGTGLKGGGGGGGGTGAGVAFGSGTLDTGFGAGAGGGYGAGGGGPGGRGTGGNGRGGNGGGGGTGNGNGGGGAGAGGPGEAKVAVGGGVAAAKGGLSPEQIRRVVMSHIGAVRACYETEAQRNPGLKGGVTIQWAIDPGGSVTTASVGGTTLSNARVEGCVVRQVSRWKFPSSDSPTTVAGFPFKFGVGG